MRFFNVTMRFIVMSLLCVVGLFFSSCTQLANFQVKQVGRIDRTRLTKVVVVPIFPILEMSQNEFLEGEKEFSRLVERIFQSSTCKVISAEQVRKDMRIGPSDGDFKYESIAAEYRPDCLVFCTFQKLVKSGVWGQFANGYFEGTITIQLSDGRGKLLTDCIGYAHVETGFGFPPEFNGFLSYAFRDLEPKLRAIVY